MSFLHSFKSTYVSRSPTYQQSPSFNMYLGPRNTPYSSPPARLNEPGIKSDSIGTECLEASSGWKPQLLCKWFTLLLGEKKEQVIGGYQANICRLGALMSCLQSSKSSLQKKQVTTQDGRTFSGNLKYEKQTWRQQKHKECTRKCKHL